MNIDPEFGHWFAGFVAGEGCFLIASHRKACGVPYYETVLRIQVRDDEREIMEEIQSRLGMGRLIRQVKNGTKYDNERSKPTIRWEAKRLQELPRLVQLFDTYPLRAKKARDYVIWRRAVQIVLARSRGRSRDELASVRTNYRLSCLKAELEKTRAYRAPEIAPYVADLTDDQINFDDLLNDHN